MSHIQSTRTSRINRLNSDLTPPPGTIHWTARKRQITIQTLIMFTALGFAALVLFDYIAIKWIASMFIDLHTIFLVYLAGCMALTSVSAAVLTWLMPKAATKEDIALAHYEHTKFHPEKIKEVFLVNREKARSLLYYAEYLYDYEDWDLVTHIAAKAQDVMEEMSQSAYIDPSVYVPLGKMLDDSLSVFESEIDVPKLLPSHIDRLKRAMALLP